MKTKKFSPQFSEKIISEARQTPAALAYPESVFTKKQQQERKERRNRTIGMVLLTPLVLFTGSVLILKVFQPGYFHFETVSDTVIFSLFFLALAGSLLGTIPPAQKWNAVTRKVIRHFYSKLCLEGKTNDLKTYLVLAPNTMQQVTQVEFQKEWDTFNQAIETEVKTQESATCTECGLKSKGLWAVSFYWFKDFFLKEKLLLLRCPKCASVYCSNCYLKLPEKHTCSQCGQKLSKEALKTFLTDPKMVRQAYISNIKIDEKSDNLADTVCEITNIYKYVDIIEPRPGSTPRHIELGDRGKIICQFTNKAVKIGNEWRLIAAGPGPLLPEQPLANGENHE